MNVSFYVVDLVGYKVIILTSSLSTRLVLATDEVLRPSCGYSLSSKSVITIVMPLVLAFMHNA